MQFKITCFAVLAAVVATVCGAAVERSDDLEARATQVDGHVFVCTDGGFAGSCTNYGIIANVCSNFPSAFQDNISSIHLETSITYIDVGPDAGWRCNAYSNFDCNDNEGHLVVQNPGYAHLGDLGWNDKISSIRCQRI